MSLLMNNFYQTNLVHNQMIFINECRDKEQDTREGGVEESRLDKGEVGVTWQTLYHRESGYWPLSGALGLGTARGMLCEDTKLFHYVGELHTVYIYGWNQPGREKAKKLGILPFTYWFLLTTYIYFALLEIVMCFMHIEANHIMAFNSWY